MVYGDDAVDKTSSSFSAHGKIGNFIIDARCVSGSWVSGYINKDIYSHVQISHILLTLTNLNIKAIDIQVKSSQVYYNLLV